MVTQLHILARLATLWNPFKSTDEGLRISILIPEEARNKNLVFWMHFYVETIDPLAVIQMEFDSGSGTYKFRAGEESVPASSVPSTGGFYSIERRNIKTPLESCTLRIYSEGGPATFYVDAAFLGVGDEFKKFVIGDMADVLYDECVAELDKRNTPEVTYVVDALDLYETDPKKWADYQFRLGDDVTVEDLKVGIITKQRVKSRTWNVLYPEQSGFQVGNVIRTQAMQAANNALQFRDIIEQTRNSQGRSDANGRAGISNSPPSSQPARYSKAFTSTSYNSLSYEGGGVVTIGSDLTYTLPGTSGSFTGLTENLSYYLYFDMNSIFDDPPAPFGITNNIDETMVSQRAIVAYVETGANGDPGLSIVTAGRPQLSGDHLITGQIDANKCVIESPGNLPIHINGTGIYSGSGYEHANSTFGISNDTGAAYFDGTLKSNAIMTAPIKTGDITTTVTPTASSVIIDQTGIKGYDATTSTPVQRFHVGTDGTGWLGDITNGIVWNASGDMGIGGKVVIGGAAKIGAKLASDVEDGAERSTTGFNQDGQITKQVDTTNITEALSDGPNRIMIDSTGIRGFGDSDGGHPNGLLTFQFNTSDGSGWFGKETNGIKWDGGGNLEVGTSVKIGSAIDSDNLNSVSAPDHNAVIIDSSGIKGFSTDGGNPPSYPQRFELNTDGSGWFGDAADGIKWTNTGSLTVPGDIVTSGIDADNITTGVLNVGGTGSDRLSLSWTTKDLQLVRGGNTVVDVGDIDGETTIGKYGINISHSEGMVHVYRNGSVGYTGSALVPNAITASVIRPPDKANTHHEAGIYSSILAEARTDSSSNGQMNGYWAEATNLDGEANGIRIKSVEGTETTKGIYIEKSNATGSNQPAYGLHIKQVSGGSGTGEGYGIYIEDIYGSGSKYAIYSKSSEESYFEGNLDINGTIKKSGGTEDFEIIDAGSSGATEQDWIEVEIGGIPGYIRVHATK